MKLELPVVPRIPYTSLSSEDRLSAVEERITYFKERLSLRKEKLKAAKLKAKPAMKALEKAKKNGRVPADVRAAAKKAEAAVALQEGKIETITAKLEKLAEKRKMLKAKVGAAAVKAKKPKRLSVTINEPARRPKVKKVKPEPAPEPEDTSIHPQDRALTKKVGDPERFRRASSRAGMMTYINAVYNKANDELFGGRLRKIHLRLLKSVPVQKFRRRGHFHPGKREIAISPNLFGSGREPLVVTTIVHEMCHQAVYDIDGVRGAAFNAEGGHGPNWRNWMTKVGLTPSRFSKYDNTEYMDEETRAQHKRKMEAFEEARKNLEPLSRSSMVKGAPVSWIHPSLPGETIPGIFVRTNDRAGKRYAILTYDPRKAPGRRSLGLMLVPAISIQNPTDKDAAEVKTERWRSALDFTVRMDEEYRKFKRLKASEPL